MNESPSLFTARLSRRQLIGLDLLAGLGFCLMFLTAATSGWALPPWARLALILGLGLPLAMRRVWPLPVFCFVLTVSIVVAAVLGVSSAYISPAYALYVVALADARGAWVPTSAIGVLTLVTLVGMVVAGGAPQPAGPAWLTNLDQPLIGIAALGGAWTVGRAVRERRHYAARDAERLAGQAVAEERLRIARELHDVVAHSVGLIAVKAGVANHVMATRPEEAHDALRVIETASRSALVEMRHLLGVLRSDETPDRGPAPDLTGLPQLAEQARLAGVEVELDLRLATGGGRNSGDDVAPHSRTDHKDDKGNRAAGSSTDRADRDSAAMEGADVATRDGGGDQEWVGGRTDARDGTGQRVHGEAGLGFRGGVGQTARDGIGPRLQGGAGLGFRGGVGQTARDGIGPRLQGGAGLGFRGGVGQTARDGIGPRLQGGAGQGFQAGTGQTAPGGTGQWTHGGTGQRDLGEAGQWSQDGATQRAQEGAGQQAQDRAGQQGQDRASRRARNGGESGLGISEGEDGSRLGAGLPEGVELSVYRIVQEALTNVVKHAAPARCRISVVADVMEVRIEVIDDGPGRRTLPVEGTGHGLIGMRERVMMYDGVFEAGHLPGRGFRVSARLPYGSTS
ncbi:sensor histidine kinase [Nonomuraea sp. CA-143628]|uniref:sensor histidine kinase n=1 Tax=Nonomuraea sp. CA-143628 TaxID=3239997 RepID=UPI003D908579